MSRKPSHPGALIREVILPETGMTISDLADRCGVAHDTVADIVNEREDITEDIAARFSRVLGSTPEFWLGMQAKLDHWKLEQGKHAAFGM